MDAEELIRRLAAALAIGLLVGTERHWRERQEAAGRRTAGVRTFALTGLLGGIMAVLAGNLGQSGGALLLGFGLAALLAAQLPLALREADAENKVSATGLVAALGTYSLGAMAVMGNMAVAGAAAVAMTAILAARESLHGMMTRITWAELRSALVLLSMTLLVMPLVPDEPIAMLGGAEPGQDLALRHSARGDILSWLFGGSADGAGTWAAVQRCRRGADFFHCRDFGECTRGGGGRRGLGAGGGGADGRRGFLLAHHWHCGLHRAASGDFSNGAAWYRGFGHGARGLCALAPRSG
ncbi:MAG: MgtC/SapB family protein [Roseomonas sp.]|nr:MgtC/SapB family protein [Roseomonas sp.]